MSGKYSPPLRSYNAPELDQIGSQAHLIDRNVESIRSEKLKSEFQGLFEFQDLFRKRWLFKRQLCQIKDLEMNLN